MEVSFPTDADGFLSQECPSCELRFKVMFGEGSAEPISYCPYCGYNGQNCWHTQAQVDYMQAIAANVSLGPELKKKLERSLKGIVHWVPQNRHEVRFAEAGAATNGNGTILSISALSVLQRDSQNNTSQPSLLHYLRNGD